jgi:hypothetical protein
MTTATSMLPAGFSFVTLLVRDVPRMAAFFRKLGWPESKTNYEHHVACQFRDTRARAGSARQGRLALHPRPFEAASSPG